MRYEVKKEGKILKVWDTKDKVYITKALPSMAIANEIKDDFNKMDNKDFTPLGLSETLSEQQAKPSEVMSDEEIEVEALKYLSDKTVPRWHERVIAFKKGAKCYRDHSQQKVSYE